MDRIAAALARRGVNFVVIGGWAAEAQGLDLGYKTNDIDFTPDFSTANLDRLSDALNDLGAMIRADGQQLPFDHDGDSLGRASVWNLTCADGNFDLTFRPAGTGGYKELLASCNMISVEVDGEKVTVPCAHPADIWLSKKGSRPAKGQRRAATPLRTVGRCRPSPSRRAPAARRTAGLRDPRDGWRHGAGEQTR